MWGSEETKGKAGKLSAYPDLSLGVRKECKRAGFRQSSPGNVDAGNMTRASSMHVVLAKAGEVI